MKENTHEGSVASRRAEKEKRVFALLFFHTEILQWKVLRFERQLCSTTLEIIFCCFLMFRYKIFSCDAIFHFRDNLREEIFLFWERKLQTERVHTREMKILKPKVSTKPLCPFTAITLMFALHMRLVVAQSVTQSFSPKPLACTRLHFSIAC